MENLRLWNNSLTNRFIARHEGLLEVLDQTHTPLKWCNLFTYLFELAVKVQSLMRKRNGSDDPAGFFAALSFTETQHWVLIAHISLPPFQPRPSLACFRPVGATREWRWLVPRWAWEKRTGMGWRVGREGGTIESKAPLRRRKQQLKAHQEQGECGPGVSLGCGWQSGRAGSGRRPSVLPEVRVTEFLHYPSSEVSAHH